MLFRRLALLLTLVVAPAFGACDGGDPENWDFYPVYDGPPVGASPADTVKPKVMIIGLDGADLRNVLPLSADGRLPHITGVMNAGVTAKLATVATASPVVWTTVATGMMPETHGIQFFRHPDTNQPAASSMRKVPALWNILSYYNRTVGVLSWWASFPAERVNGYLVSPYVVLQPPVGLRARAEALGKKDDAQRKAYPNGLHEVLADLLRRPEDVDLAKYPHLHADRERTTNTPWVIAKDTSYHEMALRMLDVQPVETVAVYFQGIDAASHDWDRWVMGPNKNEVRDPKVSPEEVAAATERVEAMYEHNDDMVGSLLAKATPDTDVIILSDHGWNYDGTSHWSKIPGVFIARGPSFAAKGAFDGISVLDITPVVLAILGVPLSMEFEGKIPDGLLTAEVMAAVNYVDSYDLPAVALPEEFESDAAGLDDEMKRRLDLLGYTGDNMVERPDKSK